MFSNVFHAKDKQHDGNLILCRPFCQFSVPPKESFYQRMQQRIESLSAAMGSETEGSTRSTLNSNVKREAECGAAPCEPAAVAAHLQGVKLREAQETGLEKRYVVSCGVQGSNDIRLHGRWMELSTHKVPDLVVSTCFNHVLYFLHQGFNHFSKPDARMIPIHPNCVSIFVLSHGEPPRWIPSRRCGRPAPGRPNGSHGGSRAN